VGQVVLPVLIGEQDCPPYLLGMLNYQNVLKNNSTESAKYYSPALANPERAKRKAGSGLPRDYKPCKGEIILFRSLSVKGDFQGNIYL